MTGTEKAETAIVTARKRATFEMKLPMTGSYVFKVLYEPRDQDAEIARKHPEAFARDLPPAMAGGAPDLHAAIRAEIKDLTSLFNDGLDADDMPGRHGQASILSCRGREPSLESIGRAVYNPRS